MLKSILETCSSPHPNTFTKKARLEDFFDEEDKCDLIIQNNHDKYNSRHSDNDSVAKNQQEYGHRKRIKP
jgi:hypothetical protein